MTSTDPPIPPDLDACEVAAHFLAGLGAATVEAVRAEHVAKSNGDCAGCRWQVATHWPCVHSVLAQRAAELLARRRLPGVRAYAGRRA
ncbi:MAG: hypothetical protein ACR2G2_18465 [Pseudonocardia sp.]